LRLSELIDEGKKSLKQAWTDVEINGLSADSRAVRPGYLFAAIPGTRVDGRAYIDDALKAGASAILAPPKTKLDTHNAHIPLITDANPRRALALIAAKFFNQQPENIVAVTGTNGKTSVAHFVQQLWNGLGDKAASIGTLGMTGPGLPRGGSLTTPDPIALHRVLADLHRDGFHCLAMEASSHGLDQNRLDGVRLKAALFTNLTRDHLDYHQTFEAYKEAKLRLFSELLPKDGIAIWNADSPVAQDIKKRAKSRDLRSISYGLAAGDIHLESKQLTHEGWSLKIRAFDAHYETELPLPGEFQISNALAAAALLHACGKPFGDLVALFPSLRGVPGRMQKAGTTPNGAAVYVDYAHTPDALETVLRAIRPHISNKLVVIFGCGGDRDRGKRPEMGTIACQHADKIIITDDNPRSEDPAVIRTDILTACNSAEEIGDRRTAIEATIKRLEPGDALIVAGKGHETGQIIGDTIYPFNDLDVARAALGDIQ
jgi:UDP-N-acetylmuramoyl-L-alanyl-D-glutamate--2,6-diaminopimelate ligase